MMMMTIDDAVADAAACGCNPMGSVRDDCEQMTGRCTCRLGVTGQKCSVCPDGSPIVAPGSCEGNPEIHAYCFWNLSRSQKQIYI